MKKCLVLFLFVQLLITTGFAQPLHQKKEFTRQDSLRGSINAYRDWWNVQRYDVTVTPDYDTKSISGKVAISFTETKLGHTLQVDLQQPMEVDSILLDKQKLNYTREGNVYWVAVRDSNATYRAKLGKKTMTVYFHGTPRAAKNAPWDGGWIWKKDAQGRPWMSVACQGLGASVWFPCKDHQGDEPDNGASLTMIVPDSLVAVANGKLKNKNSHNGLTAWTWEVKNPINSYNLVPYIGKYVNFSESFAGEKGKLHMSYWVLDYNLAKAKEQFKQAPMTLKSMEHWFGPYPWYEDDFKLVEAPHLGMEHQSAVAYGNRFQNGYLGSDLSGTGVGKKWDFIIVHEVGHEWFANNITTKDIADMWVHEGFTSYSEVLFTEYHFTKAEANKYVQGIRRNIDNDIPIIGPYGVNQEGSGDMYFKASNMLHAIRQIVNDDKLFRNMLRGLNKSFYHQVVTSKQVEDYMIRYTGKDLRKIFDQYLRTTQIPTLKLDVDDDVLRYKWDDCVEGFNMPVKLTNGQWLRPSTKWQELKMERKTALTLTADPNFYIRVKKDD